MKQNKTWKKADLTDLDEGRPRSPLKRTEEQMRKRRTEEEQIPRPSRVVRRSDRPNMGVKPRKSKEVYDSIQKRHLNK